MNIELKPCPFCGGDAEMIDVKAYISPKKRTIYRVECKKGIECPGMPGTRGYDTEREAAAAWNTRTADQERKIGRWIVEENPYAGRCLQKVYVCNICGAGVGCGYFNRRSFCPACGSEMEEADGTPLTLDRYEEWKKQKALEEEQQRQAQLEFCRSFREEDAKAAGGAPVCGAKMEVEK